MVIYKTDHINGQEMDIQKDKDNTIVQLVLQMLMEEKSLKRLIKLSFMLD